VQKIHADILAFKKSRTKTDLNRSPFFDYITVFFALQQDFQQFLSKPNATLTRSLYRFSPQKERGSGSSLFLFNRFLTVSGTYPKSPV
jgi:hypothetical protein